MLRMEQVGEKTKEKEKVSNLREQEIQNIIGVVRSICEKLAKLKDKTCTLSILERVSLFYQLNHCFAACADLREAVQLANLVVSHGSNVVVEACRLILVSGTELRWLAVTLLSNLSFTQRSFQSFKSAGIFQIIASSLPLAVRSRDYELLHRSVVFLQMVLESRHGIVDEQLLSPRIVAPVCTSFSSLLKEDGQLQVDASVACKGVLFKYCSFLFSRMKYLITSTNGMKILNLKAVQHLVEVLVKINDDPDQWTFTNPKLKQQTMKIIILLQKHSNQDNSAKSIVQQQV
mmetsp:Transcript_2323/g.3247  ORF Transcript_2323/g.3247 Transcript_2323/m.3247 type:complete len:289 (+) Transcript_2323:26-892(+)